MRWFSLLLILFAAAFLFACGDGGDEYVTEPGSGDSAEGGGDTAKKAPDQAAPKKDIPRMSPMANTIGREYKMVDAVKDYDTKKKKALERGEYYESQSVTGDANFYLGMIWRLAEEHGKAADTFVKFITQCPADRNFRTGLYYAGIEMAKDGRVAEAAGYVEQFGEKFPLEKKYWRSMASTVGYAMLADGDFSGAIDMLGTATEHGDKYSGEEMVRCMWAQGEYDQARTKANDLKAEFDQTAEQERYDSVAALASRMGKPAMALEPEGWNKERGYDTGELKDNPYLIYFWTFRNRGTAGGTEKRLTKLYDRYNGEGLEIIGLSKHTKFDLVAGKTDDSMGVEEEVNQLKVWVQTFKTPWILGLVGDDKHHDYFGFRGKVPAIALVGKKGNLRYFRDSKDNAGYAIIAKVIEKLLEE